ncbi:MAG TPA: hypothetical protein VM120_03995 [Bryobacteraceae bacterium]|nr:hypothetical protein [Bryobacteraceae bacterium]
MRTAPVRKPPAKATSSQRPRLPLRPVRDEIWAAACDLVDDNNAGEVSAVLSNRFHTSERIIDMVLVMEGMRHERTVAALRTGILSTLEQGREAAAWTEDQADVA